MIWSKGKFLAGNYISTFNTALHYSGSVWEGMRSYRLDTNKTAQIFKLTDHINRLYDSAKVLGLVIPYPRDVIKEACRELQRRNGNKELYFRPIVYPLTNAESAKEKVQEVSIDIMALRLPNKFNRQGIKIATSPDHRGYPDFDMQCKASKNYGNLSRLREQAALAGADDVFVTDRNGHYTEASAANIFVVRRGVVMTPPNDGSILPGITRGLIMDWSNAIEKKITRVDLLTASEVFITGTYAEITPVVSIDGRVIGDGKVGPITEVMRKTYFKAVRNPLWCGITGAQFSS